MYQLICFDSSCKWNIISVNQKTIQLVSSGKQWYNFLFYLAILPRRAGIMAEKEKKSLESTNESLVREMLGLHLFIPQMKHWMLVI
jgi:hypothetical protein